MRLMTKAIEQAAQKQFKKGSSSDQMVVAKFFDPCGSWTWYLMNQDPKDPDWLWGIVDGFEVEMGSFSLSELEGIKNRLGIGIERDRYFTPMTVDALMTKLNNGEHV